MSTSFSVLILILGIVEIIFAFNMEKFTRSKYSRERIRDIEGLIKWERTTTLILGVLLIIIAGISFVGQYETYANYLIGVVLVVMAVTFFGKKRFIQ